MQFSDTALKWEIYFSFQSIQCRYFQRILFCYHPKSKSGNMQDKFAHLDHFFEQGRCILKRYLCFICLDKYFLICMCYVKNNYVLFLHVQLQSKLNSVLLFEWNLCLVSWKFYLSEIIELTREKCPVMIYYDFWGELSKQEGIDQVLPPLTMKLHPLSLWKAALTNLIIFICCSLIENRERCLKSKKSKNARSSCDVL